MTIYNIDVISLNHLDLMKTSINLKLLACINLFLLDNSRPLIRTAIRVTMTLRKSPAGSGDTKLCKV